MQRGAAFIPLLFAGGLIVGALGPADPARSQTAAGTWMQKTPMPAVRGEVAAAVVGDKLFAVGGGVAGKAVPRTKNTTRPLTVGGSVRHCRRRATIWASPCSTARSMHSAGSRRPCIKAPATGCSNMIPLATAGGCSRPCRPRAHRSGWQRSTASYTSSADAVSTE
jgi:hypothetical protein